MWLFRHALLSQVHRALGLVRVQIGSEGCELLVKASDPLCCKESHFSDVLIATPFRVEYVVHQTVFHRQFANPPWPGGSVI